MYILLFQQKCSCLSGKRVQLQAGDFPNILINARLHIFEPIRLNVFSWYNCMLQQHNFVSRVTVKWSVTQNMTLIQVHRCSRGSLLMKAGGGVSMMWTETMVNWWTVSCQYSLRWDVVQRLGRLNKLRGHIPVPVPLRPSLNLCAWASGCMGVGQ